MTRRGPLLAATAVLAVALTACDPGGDPEPNYSSVTPTASASTSTSPTASPSPSIPTTGPNVSPGEVPPTRPAGVSAGDSSGAVAFVGYYIKTLDWVYATSRPDLLDPFFSSDCSTCKNGQEFIDQLVGRGTIVGGRITTNQIGTVSNDGRAGAAFAVSANLSVASASVTSSTGAVATSFPATPDVTLTEWVVMQDGEWKIVEERYA